MQSSNLPRSRAALSGPPPYCCRMALRGRCRRGSDGGDHRASRPRPDYVSVEPAAHRLYVAHRERIDVIDTRDIESVLGLGPAPGVHGAAAAPDLDRVFTSNGADGTVSAFQRARATCRPTLPG